ncbi:MAG: hypothetical protein FJ102_06500 [Deltaproteobacteria bacterium]|nr:hypothetical protein [Deltaproteobacteria bacterium]
MALLLFAAACEVSQDYGLAVAQDRPRADVLLFEEPEFELTADVRYETSQWGAQLGNCSLRLSFMLSQHDEDAQEGTSGTEVALAEDPGECVVTTFAAGEAQEAMEYDPPGYVDVGEVVYLDDERGEIELKRRASGEDTVEYLLESCTADTFPFGRTLDLVLPEGIGELAAFSVSNALTIPPALTVIEPAGEAELTQADTLWVAWTEGNSAADLSRGLTLRNQDTADGGRIIEAAHCLPVDGDTRVEVGPAVLAALTPADPAELERYALSAQVDVRAMATDVTMPWGQVARLSGNTSVSGGVRLYGE